jgi:hypothetical protein
MPLLMWMAWAGAPRGWSRAKVASRPSWRASIFPTDSIVVSPDCSICYNFPPRSWICSAVGCHSGGQGGRQTGGDGGDHTGGAGGHAIGARGVGGGHIDMGGDRGREATAILRAKT